MRRRLIALAVLTVSCASAAPPPGGPEDLAAPKLVKVTPDSGALNVRDRSVSFLFDETINDRGAGPQEVANFFLLSPSDGAPRITWRRSRIEVRPRRDFRPNTAYTVTLLPGLRDLHNNPMTTGASVSFSTGPTMPTLRIQGVAFDWLNERPASRAYVEAITPDSITYLAQADSAGRFSVGPLPPGRYLVRAIIDQNGNRALDRTEAYDSVRVVAPLRDSVELLAIQRDTLPSRILAVSIVDSVTLRVTFDRPLSPAAVPVASAFRLVREDSSTTTITAVLTRRQEAEESQRRDARAADSVRRADSVAKRGASPRSLASLRDSLAKPVVRKPSIAAPPVTLALRLNRPLVPASTYRLGVSGARALSGRTTSSERSFATPKLPPRPTAADSARARPATVVPPRAPNPAPRPVTPSPQAPRPTTPPARP